MTPAQQAALEALAGRPLAAQEYVDIDALLPARNDVAIAAILSAGQPSTLISLRVEEVFDVLFSTGDYAALKKAQLAGNPLAVMAFEMLKDAKTIGPGTVKLDSPLAAGIFDQLQSAELLSAPGRAGLLAAATRPADPIHYNTVSDGLNVAEGRVTL